MNERPNITTTFYLFILVFLAAVVVPTTMSLFENKTCQNCGELSGEGQRPQHAERVSHFLLALVSEPWLSGASDSDSELESLG